MSSAIRFILDQSKILSSGNGLSEAIFLIKMHNSVVKNSPLPEIINPDQSKLKAVIKNILTLSQTTNFRPFKTERLKTTISYLMKMLENSLKGYYL